MTVSTFETDLKKYYERKRRSYLIDQIQTAAGVMRETLLLCAVYDEVLEETISPSRDVRQQVEALQTHVKDNEFDQIESKLQETLSKLETERDDARKALQVGLHDLEDRINGFKALNRRIKKLEEDRIDELFQTVQSLDDVPADQDADYVSLEQEVRSDAKMFVEDLEAVEDALFEGFRGSNIEELVQSLIKGEEVHFDTPQDDELIALKESQLGSYITLSLEGS